MATIDQLLRTARERLTPTSPSARLDAEVLLAHALGKERSYLLTWPEREPDAGQLACFAALIAQRAAGTPVAYLTGQREFFGFMLEVSAYTLIPRPETELLVELALERIPVDATLRIADLGTGSGAIALAIARERPRCLVIATDRHKGALDTARRNRDRLGLANVTLVQGHWCAPLATASCNMLVSNPPYVAAADPYLQQGDLRFEPASALAAGADGLADIRAIIAGAPPCLQPRGWLLLEHGHDQGAAVRALLETAGWQDIATHHDLAGIERVTLARRR